MADDALWLSYKFKNINVNDLEQINQEILELPFGSYALNRQQNWQHNINGEFMQSKTMKTENNLCPWATLAEKMQHINDKEYLTNFQTCFGCTLEKTKPCNGFCLFPSNGQLKTPARIDLEFKKIYSL